MKLFFKGIEGFEGITREVCAELGLCVSTEQGGAVCVCVNQREEDGFSLTKNGDVAEITYGGGRSRFFRALSYLAEWVRVGKDAGTVNERPLFVRNGPMMDMSRNAVLNVPTVKYMLRKLALMGLNTFMLYTEDTYEIDGYPYFGYMRGRYTKKELREMDAYALSLGIELVPCIQTLGHLATALRWAAASAYKDADAVLLAGSEKTYGLIEAMMKSVSECFTTRRIHIGMDETKTMGRGRYLDLNGYREHHEIFTEHLCRVVEIVRSYGFSPMMWSDMFFRLSKPANLKGFEDYDVRVEVKPEIIEAVPRGVAQVFWDYYHAEESFYAINIEKHRALSDETVFAGGVWTWSGHGPLYDRSLRNTVPALDACRKGGVREVLATVWLNGGEGQLILSLVGMSWYANYSYIGEHDEASAAECFRRACLVDYGALKQTMRVEYPHGGEYAFSRALLYNDPLTGMMDAHIKGLDARSYYKDLTRDLSSFEGLGEFSFSVETIRALSSLLEDKSDFGIRLTEAYKSRDREALASLAEECDLIADKVMALRDANRVSWMRYCKPFGWEILDVRYGGIRARFETARSRIQAFLAGEISSIEELEEERLRFDCIENCETRDSGRFNWYRFGEIYTAGIR